MDNGRGSTLSIVVQNARHDVIESYGLHRREIDEGPTGHARWIAAQTEICENEGRDPMVQFYENRSLGICTASKCGITSRRWYLTSQKGTKNHQRCEYHTSSSWVTPRPRPVDTEDVIFNKIQTELEGKHLLRRHLSDDIWDIQSGTVQTILDIEPDKFAVLKERLREKFSNKLYWDEREKLDAEGKGCGCLVCSRYPEDHPRRHHMLGTVDHDKEEGRRLKKVYDMLNPCEIYDPVVMAAQHHVFKLRCRGDHAMKDMCKLASIAAGEMENRNDDGTNYLYSPSVVMRYRVAAKVSLLRSGGQCRSSGATYTLASMPTVHNHHVAHGLAVLVKCPDGRDLVIDMAKHHEICALRYKGKLDVFVKDFPREESVTAISLGTDHFVWHLLDRNRDLCDELGIKLPEKTKTHWIYPLEDCLVSRTYWMASLMTLTLQNSMPALKTLNMVRMVSF